jgi:single-strand DNA-binding protein
MNKVCLIGRLTKDPKVDGYGKGKNAGTVAKYTLAVDRDKDNTDFIRCVAFGKGAEFAEEYLSKGMKIGITGEIRTGSYEDKDGNTVYTTEVLVNQHDFCESKK